LLMVSNSTKKARAPIFIINLGFTPLSNSGTESLSSFVLFLRKKK
jgi:hypothetical protein